MQRLSEEKALIAAASNSEEKRNIGTGLEKRDTTSLQDRTVERSRCAKCFQCAVYRMLIVVNCRSQYKFFKVKHKETQERLDKELLRWSYGVLTVFLIPNNSDWSLNSVEWDSLWAGRAFNL